jgi:nucleoside-diphosphate-sugar epimerase
MSEGRTGPGALVALTGATGFIGQHLLRELPKRGYRCRVLLRRPVELELDCASAVIGDLTRPQNLSTALADVGAVVHSAGVPDGASGLPDADHRQLTVEATRSLARAAQRAGVKRFVYLSSIRAQNGPRAEGIVTEEQTPAPADSYGRAKLEAERAIAEFDMDWVALRPALVYGRGAKGNIAALADLARSPYPLPFGGLKARRSLLAVANLVDAVDAALAAPGPLRRPFVVADEEPMSVAGIIRAMRRGLGRGPGLISIPAPILKLALELTGRGEWYERVAYPLIVNAEALRAIGWRPSVRAEQALQDFMQG